MSSTNELLDRIRLTLRTTEQRKPKESLQLLRDAFNELDLKLSGGGDYPSAWSFWQQGKPVVARGSQGLTRC